jgi:hypothetical protein
MVADNKTQSVMAALLFASMPCIIGCRTTVPARPVERSPLKPARYDGWKKAFKLENDRIEIVIVPSVGRITHIGLKGKPNILREDEELRGKRISKTSTFTNVGGDWFWPMAQSHWNKIADSNWPPPPAIGEAPWKAEAWTNRDGSQSCLLMRGYGDPVHAWASRLITLDARLPRIRIRQRLFQSGPAREPLTLWNITQITRPLRVILPGDGSGDLIPIMFDAPPDTHMRNCGQAMIFDARKEGEFKVGVAGSNTWIAAQSEHGLLIERAFNDRAGPYPDGGCPVEWYANSEAGYVEIENLSPEVLMATGESLENTLVIECHRMDKSLDDSAVADKVLDLLKGITQQ